MAKENMNFVANEDHWFQTWPTYPFVAALLFLLLGLCGGCSGGQSAQATQPTQPTQATLPCDIYAAASPATPCVAAYSTTRALYSAYTSSLYQVTRQSDQTTANVGLLPDGYADASIQDTFCAGTVCTITKIYDQSSYHNDLTPAPPGGNANGNGPNGYDLPATADSLPIIVGGHKVYGILVSPGIGYRNDATSGVPQGTQPEGVYMVSSTLAVPTQAQCCFDFGNAETNNDDDGYGAMDAMNLIIDGHGIPAAGLDMENGVPGDWEMTPGTQFVTEMGWNNGMTNYEVYWGNAQSGSLSATGSRTLPSQYQPMKQQGAIILGIGGDNSNFGPGYFFEGVMTAGTPSDSSMNSVQADIVSAGYEGAPVTLHDGNTYTFQNQKSQLALDNACDGCLGPPTNGVAVVQNSVSGAESQQWTLHAQGNGYFTMVNVQSGMCLDDPWGNGTPSRQLPQSQGTSTMLWQLPCNGDTPQNWLFVPQSDSSFVIENQGSTTTNAGTPMVIDDYYGQTTAGLQMWLDTSNDLAPQRWLAALPPGATASSSGTISDGAAYTLLNQSSQLLLANDCDGCSGSATDGVAVVQNAADGLADQQWTLHSQGNGYLTIVSVQSGLCLEDPWGNGTPSRQLPQSQGTSTMLWQQPCNSLAPQNWKFIPQSNGYFVIVNQAATTANGSQMVVDDYNGQTTQGLQMWLTTANGLTPQNWRLDIQ
jgi:non-reducing end alpha-L-arabinofuranosidase